MKPLSTDEIERLTRAAMEARKRAHAPYSRFQVGAALLTDDGQIFTGCNIENASYSLCLCAERVAAASAVADGHRSWRAIAVATDGGVTPCGACRQFLAEFGSQTTIVIIDTRDGTTRSRSLAQLLPDAFDASELPNE